MTADMAWPEYRIAVEYDGDYHRTDKAQWGRDQEKRSRPLGRGWMVFVATAASIQDESAAAEFTFAVARVLKLKGARVRVSCCGGASGMVGSAHKTGGHSRRRYKVTLDKWFVNDSWMPRK